MNILLVRPNTPSKSINLQSFMICEPLELEYVAAELMSEGHDVDLVDMLLEKKPLLYFLKQKQYDVVAMTAYITTVGVVKEYAKIIKDYKIDILGLQEVLATENILQFRPHQDCFVKLYAVFLNKYYPL